MDWVMRNAINIHWFLHKFNIDLVDTLRAFKACNSRLYGSMLSVCRHFIAMTTVANYNHGNRRHFIAMATVAIFSLLPSSFEVLLPFEHVVKLSVKDLNSLAKT